jgi:hypothetical protein
MTAHTKMALPLAGVVCLAALWSAYWFIASGAAQGALAEQRAALAAEGLTLTCAREDWGGFPFRFAWTCEKPSLSLATSRGPVTVSATGFEALAMAYNPWHLLAAMAGPTQFKEPGLALTAAHEPARGSLLAGRNPSATLEIKTLKIDQLGAAARLLISARATGAEGDLAADAAGVVVERPEIDIPIDSASLRAHGTLAGKVEINELSLTSGKIEVQGSGEGELGASGLLTGRFGAETNDIDGLLNLVAPVLHMSPAEQASVRTMFATGKVTLTVKDGTVYWGLFPIAKIDPVKLP